MGNGDPLWTLEIPSELYKISGDPQSEGVTDAFLDNFRENSHILPVFVKQTIDENISGQLLGFITLIWFMQRLH